MKNKTEQKLTKAEKIKYSYIIQRLEKGERIRGFVVSVGNKKNSSGIFEYAVTKKEARKKGKELLIGLKKIDSYLNPLKNLPKYKIHYRKTLLKKCRYCDNLTENSILCLRCEKIYNDFDDLNDRVIDKGDIY